MSNNGRALLLLLNKCKSMQHLKQVHAQVLTAGLGDNSYSLSRLMAFCADPNNGSASYAHLLFRHIDSPTLCICNTMLKALLLQKDYIELLGFYCRMLHDGIFPDNYTLPYVLKACVGLQHCGVGSEVHGHVLKFGLNSDVFVGSTLILMYMVLGDSLLARKVFDEMPRQIPAAWTVMVSGYSNLGEIEAARVLFDEAVYRDLGLWGAMVSGYVHNNCFKEGLLMFREMQVAGLEPDEGVLVSVLCACTQVGGLDLGQWLHNYINWIRLPMSTRLGTALVDMYAKCGNLGLAQKLFSSLPRKDTVCWNVMISALAIHGDGDGALQLFADMQKDRFRPDEATFLAVLSACSHAGKVKEGLNIFNSMRSIHQIEPKAEHYGCMVDFLGRCGLFEDARELLERMPSSSSCSEKAVAWRALLSACSSHGEVQMGEIAASHLLQLEVHSGVFVLLSNIYENCGRHDDAMRMKKSMRHRGVLKTPGCSSIEVGGRVHEFVAGEQFHPQIDDIYCMLVTMSDKIASAG